jgi:mRNA-degrading endonuclease RelE of RelBE toxin-antitoxin system
MKLVPSPRFRKSLRRLSPQIQQRVREKLKLFLENKHHPSLRYKTVQALKHEAPPVKEISITMSIRVTLQEFEDHVYLRNVGGHDILP